MLTENQGPIYEEQGPLVYRVSNENQDFKQHADQLHTQTVDIHSPGDDTCRHVSELQDEMDEVAERK